LMAPDGDELLKSTVVKRFYNNSKVTVAAIIQEIMQSHASEIHFREKNAGKTIDAHMTDAGFNIDIRFDAETGLIFGGNQWNCGTWMDKMGESTNAGTIGVPATARDGAAVEIIGLLKSTTRWLVQLAGAGKFAWSGVVLRDGSQLSYEQWDQRIQKSFSKCFYVPLQTENQSDHQINSTLVNRRGIFKDTYRASAEWTDYQFRPNFLVAMTVAPELFSDSDAALRALQLVKSVLLGPLGMKTLDPADWAYRPEYDQQLDSTDRSMSKGYSYHQGPEWLWPVGMFLRAYIRFHRLQLSKQQLCDFVFSSLRNHRSHLLASDWAGLPELTNRDATPCKYSCPTQAWSFATIIDALQEL